MLEVPEEIRCVLLCMLEAVDGGLCLLEAMRRVMLCMLEAVDGRHCSLEALEGQQWGGCVLLAGRVRGAGDAAVWRLGSVGWTR